MEEGKTSNHVRVGLDVLGISFISSGLSLLPVDMVVGLSCAVVGVICVILKQKEGNKK